MKTNHLIVAALFTASMVLSGTSHAIGEAAQTLQAGWDIVKYQTPDKDKEKAYEQLAKQAKDLVALHPNDAEVLTWEAIILSSYAGEKGGLGALGLVKQAKAELEKAEKIDPKVLNGAVYTTLGSLYYQVPGWPLGFGDDDKAESYLKKGLALAPNDIDANYFYGDFLLDDGRYAEAIPVLEKALAAAPRAGRDVADSGRKQEIQHKLDAAKSKI